VVPVVYDPSAPASPLSPGSLTFRHVQLHSAAPLLLISLLPCPAPTLTAQIRFLAAPRLSNPPAMGSVVEGDVSVESISPFGKARSTVKDTPLSDEELKLTDDYMRASLYLCLGMLYLKQNPLLTDPLKVEHLKARLLGHWGSDAGQIFTYVAMNRLIKKYDLDVIFISGPGHGAPAVISQSYLEGVYSEVYPDKSEDVEGLRKFFKQFSFPGGIGSHATPETPGSLHEGGEF
jgi:hypothetical protein